jgi:MFS family permease
MLHLPALRHRDFRLLWLGQLFSMVGSQMQIIAVNWHVYLLLRNQVDTLTIWHWHLALNAQAVGLGSLGAVRVLPIFVFAFLGGAVADHWDKRLIILWSQIAAGLCALLLGILTLRGDITLFLLYLFTACNAAIDAFNDPAQNSLFPELVTPEALPNAATLFSFIFQFGIIAGPMFAGLLIVIFPIGVVYLANAGSFLLVLVAILLMQHRSSRQRTQDEPFRWRSMLDGFHFVRSTPLIWNSMRLDFVATFFASARTMLPLVAGQILHTGAQGYGFLATAQPVGAVVTGSILSVRKPMRRQGYALLGGVALYGLATALFGLAPFFVLSYIFFALTGVGDTISDVVRSTIRQRLTPAHLRGRMMSVQMILALGGPQLGEMESGLLTALLGTSLTIFAGGMVTFLFVGWIAWRYPALRTYRHIANDPSQRSSSPT